MGRFFSLCVVVLALLAASCVEAVDNPKPTSSDATALAPGRDLPEAGEVDGILPAYQTEREIDEAGKADAIDIRASHEETYGFTHAPSSSVRTVAEWEPVDGVLVAWEDGLQDFVVNLIAALSETTTVYVVTPSISYSQALQDYFYEMGLDTNRIRYFEYGHESFWARDFGPITVELSDGRPAFVDMSYYWNRRRDDAIPTLMGAYFDTPVYRPRVASEGGNFMSNGEGLCAVTTWMLEENAHLDAASLSGELRRYLGCRETLIVERLEGEGTGHIDMFAKFTQPDTVLVGAYDPRVDPVNAAILDRNAERLSQMQTADGARLRVVRIPMPSPRYPVYESFTNSLLVNGTAIVPSYSGARHLEDAAIEAYREALPAGFRIVMVDSTNVIEWGGAVHCTTMAFNTRPIGSGALTPAPAPTTDSTDSYSSRPNARIQDGRWTTAVIDVDDDRGSMGSRLEVGVAIEHTYVGDLYIVLEHDGVQSVLYDGSGPGRNLSTRFTSDDFTGTQRGGRWALSIADRADRDEGMLSEWSIRFH